MSLRLISWNLNVRSNPNQWDLLQSLRPDVALLQEWRRPEGFEPEGHLHSEEYLPGRHTAVWSRWPLGELDRFPRGAGADWSKYEPALGGCVVSATTRPAGSVSATSVYAYPCALKEEQLESFDPDALRLPSAKEIWPIDLVWWGLKEWAPHAGMALVGGDLNTSRVMDEPRPRGNAEFFARMAEAGWDECARHHYPEEPDAFTYKKANTRAMQLDHIFASPGLAPSLKGFRVERGEEFKAASDHFPLVAEFDA